MGKLQSGRETSDQVTSVPEAAQSGSSIQQLRSEIARLAKLLQERDERLKLAETSAGIGVWDIDVASDTVRGTAQFFRIMGLPFIDAPVPMQLLRQLRVAEDRDAVNHGWDAAVKAGTDTYDSEYRITRPDGEVRWIFGRGSVIRDVTGRPVRYSGIDIDVTDRKRAERELAESETRLRLAVEAADLGIWDWRTLTNEMEWSARAKAIAGFPLDQPVTFEQVRNCTHPDDLPRTAAMARRALDPLIRAREPFEYRLVRPDGEVRWVLAHGEARFANIDGQVRAYRYTGTIQDITDRKLADAELQRSEARLRRAHLAGGIGDWEIDLQSSVVTWSESQYALLGWPRSADPIRREDFEKRIHPDDWPNVDRVVQAAFETGRFDTEFRALFGDGNYRWVASRGEIHRDASGRPTRMTGINFDVTAQREAREQQKLLIDELNHRVKNTLAMVQSFASLTLKNSTPGEFHQALMGRILALSSAHDLLTRGRWKGTSLRDLVDAELAAFDRQPSRIERTGDDVPLSTKEAIGLGMVIHELATNAVKHGALSVPGGSVAVTWRTAENRPDRVQILWVERGGPKPEPPSRSGFGSRLIKQTIATDLLGNVDYDYDPAGLRCSITIPVSASGEPSK